MNNNNSSNCLPYAIYSLTQQIFIECLTMRERRKARQFLKNEKSTYNKRKSCDMNTFSEAVRMLGKNCILAHSFLKILSEYLLWQSPYYHCWQDKLDSKAKMSYVLKTNV